MIPDVGSGGCASRDERVTSLSESRVSVKLDVRCSSIRSLSNIGPVSRQLATHFFAISRS